MSDRSVVRKFQDAFAAHSAIVAVAVLVAAPALASRIPCTEVLNAEPDATVDALIAETVGHNVTPSKDDDEATLIDTTNTSASLLAPRAEEAIKDAFKENISSPLDTELQAETPPVASSDTTDSEDVKAKTVDSDEAFPAARMNTRLPGLSDVATSRYKKQMFRRDI